MSQFWQSAWEPPCCAGWPGWMRIDQQIAKAASRPGSIAPTCHSGVASERARLIRDPRALGARPFPTPCASPVRAVNRAAFRGARLPIIHGSRPYVEAGGLVSYGPDIPDMFRRAADYVDKTLHGAKPGDLSSTLHATLCRR